MAKNRNIKAIDLINLFKILRKDSFDDMTGPDVFLKFFLAFSDVMSINRSS